MTAPHRPVVCRMYHRLTEMLLPDLGPHYTAEASATFERLYRDARRTPAGAFVFLAREARALIATAWRESRASARASQHGSRPFPLSQERPPMLSRWMDHRRHDLRQALRRFGAHRGFAALAIAIMGLGIGANSAIFSIVNAVLLRPLPYADPQELVRIFTNERGNDVPSAVSHLDFHDYRALDDMFVGMVAYSTQVLSYVTDDGSEAVFAEFVSSDFFDVMGLAPAAGRAFTPDEDEPGVGQSVALVTYETWQRRFGADPTLVGRTLRLNNQPVTVVGIGPRGYRGSLVGFTTEFLVPWGTAEVVDPSAADRRERRDSRGAFVAARLRPGTTIEAASASLNALAHGLGERFPETNADRTVSVLPLNDVRLHPVIDNALYPVAGLLMAVVGLVLVVACTNLANLMLVHAMGRRREIAVRLALGAPRRRIIGQLLTESTLLGTAGGAVGLLIAYWTARGIVLFKPPIPFPVTIDLSIDGTVLAFTFLVAVGCGVFFGLVPAFRSSRPDLVSSLKEEQPRLGRSRRLSWRNALVVGQVTVSVLLLITAGLFVRSLRNTQRIDPGFATSGVAMIRFGLATAGYGTEEAGRPFIDEFVERLRGAPGVRAVAVTNREPVGITVATRNVHVPDFRGASDDSAIEVDDVVVSPEYFDALEIPIVRGRNFFAADRGGPPVAIVSQTMARTFWGTENVLGTRFVLGRDASGVEVEIVGVARDTKVRTLGERPRPLLYRPYAQEYDEFAMVIASTSADPATLVQTMRGELRTLDPAVPIFDAGTMTDNLGIALFVPRMGAMLMTAFGLLAISLASIGLYGVVAFSVAQRTREVGIRVALGAQRGQVTTMVLREGLGMVSAGVALGLALSLVATRPLGHMLVGVAGSDPATFGSVAVVLIAVAAAASWFPARRAAAVDPIKALRAD